MIFFAPYVEDLVYHEGTHTAHTTGCSVAPAGCEPWPLDELRDYDPAPTSCARCWPGVEMRLSRQDRGQAPAGG